MSNLTHAKHASKQEREGCSSVKGRRRDQDVDVLGWLEVRGCGSGSGWLRLVLGQRSDRERQSISVFGASDDVIHSRVGCGSAWEVKSIHSHIPIRARLSQRRVQGKGLEYRQSNSTFKKEKTGDARRQVDSRAKRQGKG